MTKGAFLAGAGMDRRDFLKAAGSAAALCAVGSVSMLSSEADGASGAASAVVGVGSGDGAAAAKAAVGAIGGIGAFVSRGDVVVVKPNIGWDRTPAQAANTAPEVVVAVIEMCLSAGAKTVKVFDRTCNEPRRCYANSGIQAAVEAFAKKSGAGSSVSIFHAEDRKFVRTKIPNALALNEWELHRDALEADKMINVPVAKHHTLGLVTLGLKNTMGIMGGNRSQLHTKLPEILVDVNRRVPSRLTVIDATRVLLRNGPSGGNLADVKAFGKVFASADILAADVIAASRLFNLQASDVPHLAKALSSGTWVGSPDRIRVTEA